MDIIYDNLFLCNLFSKSYKWKDYHLMGLPCFFHSWNSEAAVNSASVEEFILYNRKRKGGGSMIVLISKNTLQEGKEQDFVQIAEKMAEFRPVSQES